MSSAAQLRAENEQLHLEGDGPQAGPSTAASVPSGVVGGALPAGPTVAERLVVVPRERRRPMSNGETGLCITESVEEVQACMCTCHLSLVDLAFFIIDHVGCCVRYR